MLLSPLLAVAVAAAAVSPQATPPKDTAQVAEDAGHLVWVDDAGRVLDRSGGQTAKLPISGRIRGLDVGTDARGRAVAVYVRCRPGCDVWRFDLTARTQARVPGAAAAVTGESLPTVHAGRVAFVRAHRVMIAPLTGGSARTVMRPAPDDLELGDAHLAFVGLYDTREGNGSLQLRIRSLASSREQVLAKRVIGERSSTGVGGLAFAGRTLAWQQRRRDGCTIRKPTFRSYTLGAHGPSDLADPPADVTAALVVPPETPESQRC